MLFSLIISMSLMLCVLVCPGHCQDTPPEMPLFIGNEKLMNMIEARILSRKGLYQKSLKMYRSLRQKYSADENIWEDYIEALVNFPDYELAHAELTRLLKKNPGNIRAQRLRARIYTENRQFRWAFPVYEDILKRHGRNPGVWSDYAYASRDAGDWLAALNYFSRVLESDPDNRMARVNVHSILREHRPRMTTSYSFRELDNHSRTRVFSLNYNQHFTQKTRLFLDYGRIVADRTEGPGLSRIHKTVDQASLRLDYRLSTSWGIRAGAGGYTGMSGETSFFAGLDYKIWKNAHVNAEYAGHQPWYDPIEAVKYDGHSDQFSLSFEWHFAPTWRLYLGADQKDYYAYPEGRYGRKKAFTGVLSKRLSHRPDFYLSYSFHRSQFSYTHQDFRPISMIESEGTHTFFWNFEHWPCTYWAYSFSGGGRWDAVRSVRSWYVVPGLRVRLGNRVEAGIRYEYSSEADTPDGGDSHMLGFEVGMLM